MLGFDPCKHSVHQIGVDRLRLLTAEPQQNSRISSVTFSGKCERAVQPDFEFVWCFAGLFNAANELARRLHRSDRMRTGRSDADLENIEDADGGQLLIDVAVYTHCQTVAQSIDGVQLFAKLAAGSTIRGRYPVGQGRRFGACGQPVAEHRKNLSFLSIFHRPDSCILTKR